MERPIISIPIHSARFRPSRCCKGGSMGQMVCYRLRIPLRIESIAPVLGPEPAIAVQDPPLGAVEAQWSSDPAY